MSRAVAEDEQQVEQVPEKRKRRKRRLVYRDPAVPEELEDTIDEVKVETERRVR